MIKRKIIQSISFVGFILLILMNKMQLWMVIFGISLLLSTYYGRFYCGYICPINAGMELIDDNANATRRVRKEVPKFFKHKAVRYIILGLFLMLMAFTFKTAKRLPILPILFVSGIVLAIFYKPEFFHRYLCPYGSLLSLFSKYNKKTYKVYNEDCIKCGRCVSVCPADAFIWESREDYPVIISNECLQCKRCVATCPTQTIK